MAGETWLGSSPYLSVTISSSEVTTAPPGTLDSASRSRTPRCGSTARRWWSTASCRSEGSLELRPPRVAWTCRPLGSRPRGTAASAPIARSHRLERRIRHFPRPSSPDSPPRRPAILSLGMHEHVTFLRPDSRDPDARGVSSGLPADLLGQSAARLRILALLYASVFFLAGIFPALLCPGRHRVHDRVRRHLAPAGSRAILLWAGVPLPPRGGHGLRGSPSGPQPGDRGQASPRAGQLPPGGEAGRRRNGRGLAGPAPHAGAARRHQAHQAFIGEGRPRPRLGGSTPPLRARGAGDRAPPLTPHGGAV